MFQDRLHMPHLLLGLRLAGLSYILLGCPGPSLQQPRSPRSELPEVPIRNKTDHAKGKKDVAETVRQAPDHLV